MNTKGKSFQSALDSGSPISPKTKAARKHYTDTIQTIDAEVYPEPSTQTIVTTPQASIQTILQYTDTAEDAVTSAATAEQSKKIKQEILAWDEIKPSPPSPKGTSSPENNVSLRDQVDGTSISYSSTKKPSSPGPTDRAPDEMYEISPHLFTPVNAGLENKVKQPSNGELALKIKK